VRLTYTSLDYYSRFEWNDVSDPREISGRLRPQGAYVVLRANQESLLRGTPARVEIVDRRAWLDENWMTAALHPDRFRLESLMLVRVQPIQELVARARPRGSAPPSVQFAKLTRKAGLSEVSTVVPPEKTRPMPGVKLPKPIRERDSSVGDRDLRQQRIGLVDRLGQSVAGRSGGETT
jgi:hypothetical protein